MSKYKTFETYLRGKLQSIRNIKDEKIDKKAIEIIFEEVIDSYVNLYKKVQGKIEIEIEGWKGIGKINIYENFNTDFTIVEHIKNKETGEIDVRKTIVPVEKVNKMLEIVRNLDFGIQYRCYYIAKKLGWDWKELWKERRIYFSDYYYPLKILESLGIINYFGRGSVMRKG